MNWSYAFGDNNSTRLSVSFSLSQWLIGVAWSDQDIVVDLLCFSVSLDWFEP